MGTISRATSRGFSIVDMLLLILLGIASVTCAMNWYEGRDCKNLASEAERLMPKIAGLTLDKEKETPGKRVEMNDCAFTDRGMAGDCTTVGVTSNFATTYAYVVVPQTAGPKVFAIGQTPVTYGSVISLDENGKYDRSAAGCR